LINLKHYNDLSEVKRLISECMWADEERVNNEFKKYLEVESRELLGSFYKDELVGLIGVIHESIGVVELKHIAIKSNYRGKGIGRKMIHEYVKAKNIVTMKAETDKDAVGFYKKLGFSITSLGEKYPRVERFECIFLTDNDR
jgi:ribosomal protein S18 acetylase RimI-like enzyme